MGPLHGLRIIEMAGVGPIPLCGMILSDLGADLIRIERPGGHPAGPLKGADPKFGFMNRGRPSVALDVKTPEGIEAVLALAEKADALIEGFRPGVMERLGLGPDVVMKRNPRLVFGRVTGWGQDGPLAKAAGHDINYIALTGVLHAIGLKGGKPVAPLNLVGDFGGGTMLLAIGVLAALIEAKGSGKGQVIDAAMTEGSALLLSMMTGWLAHGAFVEERGGNLLDGGAHFYDAYETKDGQFVTIGAIEPEFYALFRQKTGLTGPEFDMPMQRESWPALKEKVAAVFKTRTRAEWCTLLEGTDVCFAPVLTMKEAFTHPHHVARGSYVERDGVMQPAPAPRFSRTKPEIGSAPAARGADTERALRDWGFSDEKLAALKKAGAISS